MLLIAVTALMAYADTYKLLYVNTETIKIGKKMLMAGDTFADSERIVWSSDKQAFKAQNLTNKKIRVFSPRMMDDSKNIEEYYLKQNQLSTRGRELDELLEDVVEADYCLMDSVRLKTWIDTTDEEYFVLKYTIDGQNYSQRVEGSERFIMLRSTMEGRDVTNNLPEELTVAVWYHFANGTEEVIAEDWTIVFL